MNLWIIRFFPCEKEVYLSHHLVESILYISKMVLVDHFNINNIAEIKVNLSVVNKSKVSYYTY